MRPLDPTNADQTIGYVEASLEECLKALAEGNTDWAKYQAEIALNRIKLYTGEVTLEPPTLDDIRAMGMDLLK
jgi:hypothetical protein